ncbi:MAG TPA: hypothetical protein VGM90_31460 [Kofleriaceae bacterium]|jgi:tetratricopeptide (TPR) repeat protein
MPALRKPHRVGVLLPQLTIEGSDAAYAPEAALVLWLAVIEALQRHPMIAVYDPESTPLVNDEGHFAPDHATVGATPSDNFYAFARRDEVLWLEAVLPKGAVRLHVIARDGAKSSFDALGRNFGDQVDQAISSWLNARKLGALPKKVAAAAAEDLIAVTKPIAALLVEQAGRWATPISASTDDDHGDAPEDDDDAPEDDDDKLPPSPPTVEIVTRSRPGVGRAAINRMPTNTFRVAALRVVELALGEDLGDLILAVDAEHPQALFARFEQRVQGGIRDFALLRRVIAAAPCWARPYAELARPTEDPEKPGTPSELETVAGAGIAALCRPQNLRVIERVAALLADSRLGDEGVRLLERALTTLGDDSSAHLALLEQLRESDREGAWLAQARISARQHGCPMDVGAYWYPDQIMIDLALSDAFVAVGRLDEAIALRANRIEGHEATWPRHTRILTNWRKNPRFVAWSFAREGSFRGEPERAVEGFGRVEPGDAVDVALLIDALVATGKEDEVAFAWAQHGLGRGYTGAVARLAAARGLFAANEWRRGLEELWRVELAEPGRDEQVAISRCGRMLSCAPLDVLEAAIGERVALGATSLARRMARDIADFAHKAATSSVITRALGKQAKTEMDPTSLDGFAATTASKRAIDALFTEVAPINKLHATDDDVAKGDRLVNRWLEVAMTGASEEQPESLAQAAAYTAAHALGRYLALTTGVATSLAGALRTVAAEALALVRRHRTSLADRDARALLRVVEPLLRRVDRWVGSNWLGTVERSLGLDERAAGDIAGFAADYGVIVSRALGPEESAVLATSVARLHREHPNNWAAAVVAQATQLALHTGYLGAVEWADAVVAQLAAKELELDDGIDELLTTCYLAEEIHPGPAVHAARVLLDAGRGSAALSVLAAGLPAARKEWRDRNVPALEAAWTKLNLDVSFDFAKGAAQMFQSLQGSDPVRAERIGRWLIAYDPTNAEAHRNLGLALAMQGKAADALVHLMRATPEQATQIVSGVLHQAQHTAAAMTLLDYASRWYVRAEQWLTFGGIAYAAMDNPRTVRAYRLAWQLDPDAYDASQLNAYAGVLDEVGDYVTCELIAKKLITVAGDDIMWKTNGWNHLACAYIGLGKFDEAVALATDALAQNPLPDNAGPFTQTLERAKTKTQTTPPAAQDSGRATNAWRTRRETLEQSRYRYGSENAVAVTPRALAAATTALADTAAIATLDACVVRAIALQIREQAYFARDPVPVLGDRMTRDAFYTEFRARGGVVLGEAAPPPAPFKDRTVIPGSPIARISDYVALLRDLATLAPKEAIAQFALDDASYLEVARAWASALEADATLAPTIAAGLAKK